MESVTTQPLQPAKRPFFRRRHPVLFFTFLAVAAVVLLFAGTIFLGGRIDLARARKAARDKGYPVTLREFVAKLHKADPDRNAAPLYVRAWETYDADLSVQNMRASNGGFIPFISDTTRSSRAVTPGGVTGFFGPIFYDYSVPLAGKELADSRAFLQACREVLDLVREARRFPDASYDSWRMGPDTGVHRYSTMQGGIAAYDAGVDQLVRLAVLAAVVEGSAGRARESVEHMLDAVAVARSVRNDPASPGYSPLLAPGFVSISPCMSILCDGLQRVIGLANPSNEDLRCLQTEAAALAGDIPTSLGLRLEFTLAGAADASSPPDRYRYRAMDYFPALEKLGIDRQARNLPSFLFATIMRRDRAQAVRELVDYLDNARTPSSAFLRTAGFDVPAILHDRRFPYAVDVSTIRGTMMYTFAARAKLCAAASGLAALRYRKNADDWPATLGALVPEYLPEIPTDPFSGRDLLYFVKSPDTIIVYSVGANGIDDGGAETYDRTLQDRGLFGCDVPFKIELKPSAQMDESAHRGSESGDRPGKEN